MSAGKIQNLKLILTQLGIIVANNIE